MDSCVSWAYLFVVGQGLLLSILLLFRKGLANRIFSALLFIVTGELFARYLFRSFIPGDFASLFHFRYFILFMYGPIMYLYLAVSIGKISSLKPVHLLYAAVPALLAILRYATVGPHVFRGQSGSTHGDIFTTVYYFSMFCFVFVYTALISRLIADYMHRISTASGKTSRVRRRWVFFFGLYSFCMLSLYFVSLAMTARGSLSSELISHIFCAVIALPIPVTGYVVIRRSDMYGIIHQEVAEPEPEVVSPEAGEKYAKTRLPDDVREAYLAKILDLLDREKIYLEPEITLADFADKAGIAAHHVSQVINTMMSHNFYTLMNSRRIDYAKTLLVNPESAEKTVLDIAFESGFNSKTTFNTVFKEMTGMTPSKYRSGICACEAGKPIAEEMLTV
ncbi:MAG TPA: helix-turn-helix transcriptional regulator [Spirochaetota bacterium]|nr:helix-turn-helix transcriptional regulator [Spirochaetota bacterium]